MDSEERADEASKLVSRIPSIRERISRLQQCAGVDAAQLRQRGVDVAQDVQPSRSVPPPRSPRRSLASSEIYRRVLSKEDSDPESEASMEEITMWSIPWDNVLQCPATGRLQAAEETTETKALSSFKVKMPASAFRLLREQETERMVTESFKAVSIDATFRVSDSSGDGKLSLEVSAPCQGSASAAATVLQSCIVEQECLVPHGNPDFTQSADTHNFLQTLENKYTGKVRFNVPQKGGKIVVTATSDVIKSVTEEINDRFRYNSCRSVTFRISENQLRYLRDIVKADVRATEEALKEHFVNIFLDQDCLKVHGTRQGLELTKENLEDLLQGMRFHEHTLTDRSAITFLNKEQCKGELELLEKYNHCVLCLEPGTAGSKTLHRERSSLTVKVIQGDIAKQQVDMIVSTVTTDLNLSKGAVSTAVLKAAGQKLKAELNSVCPEGLDISSVVYTSGHDLPCKRVCHMCLMDWVEKEAEKTLYKLIIACLTEADQRAYTSVAFPLIGTAELKYPLDAVGSAIMDAVNDFHNDVPCTTLNDIRIVVHDQDDVETYQTLTMIQEQREVFSADDNIPDALGQEPKTSLYICTRDPEDVTDVINAFDEMLHRHIKTKDVNDQISETMPEQRERVEQICDQHDVSLSLDLVGHTVLTGLDSAVYNAREAIKDFVHDNLIQRFVQWSYLKPTEGDMEVAPHSPENNRHIEHAYVRSEEKTEITIGSQTVVVDFTSMIQYPKDSNDTSETCILLRRNTVEEGNQCMRPQKWTSQDLRVLLEASSTEFSDAKSTFESSLGDKQIILWSIQRIQNEKLWRQYSAQKDFIEKQNYGLVKEMTLWHGTEAGAVDRIINYGFNRSYCGKNATNFGEGVYFAVNSGYSAGDTYSKPDASGKKYVFLCKVLVGYSAQGHERMRVLPDRDDGIPYDSATDNPDSPTVYIVFSDNQAYPEYLITFEVVETS